MTVTRKHTGKAISIPGGLAISTAFSMITTIVLSMIIADFLNKETITWEQAGYWIMGMLLTASFIGGKISIMAIKRQRLMVSIMSGVLYWIILLCITALFFGGNFDSILVTAGLIMAGCVSASLLSAPVKRKRGKKRG